MVEIAIVYQGELRCEAVHGPSGVRLITDAPVDNHGKGASFSPTDLVGTALGSCILTTIGIVAEKMGVDITGATVAVKKEMASAPIRRIARLTTQVTISGNLSDEQKQKFEKVALLCPVHQSLHPDIDAPITFHWA